MIKRKIRAHVRNAKKREMFKTASTNDALTVFNNFVKEVRSEIKRSEKITVKGILTHNQFNELSFMHDKFRVTLTLN